MERVLRARHAFGVLNTPVLEETVPISVAEVERRYEGVLERIEWEEKRGGGDVGRTAAARARVVDAYRKLRSPPVQRRLLEAAKQHLRPVTRVLSSR